MRVGKAANFENVLGALGKLFVDPDVLLEDGSCVELRLIVSLTRYRPLG